MKNTLRRIMAMALAILMVLTSGPLTAVAEIVSGNQTDTAAAFSLRSLQPYTKTLHATFVYKDKNGEPKPVAEQYVLAGGTLSVPATPEKKDHKFTGWTPSISGAPEPGATVSADFLAGGVRQSRLRVQLLLDHAFPYPLQNHRGEPHRKGHGAVLSGDV